MGDTTTTRESFALSASIFLRLLAVVHLVAFASAWLQVDGLIGVHGIAPAGQYLDSAREQLGASAYRELPTLCWMFGTGTFLDVLGAAGVVLSLLLFAGVAPVACLLLLWLGYLSLVNAGQMFFAYQWDGLLLEATLLAVWIAPRGWTPGWRSPSPAPLARLLLWWLLFRLMFLGGVVKLTSGDPTWRNLSALTFHFETQPLPTPLAWFAQQMPRRWHQFECAAMFVIELGVPFLLFGPRRLRHAGALVLAAFMAAVAATGNHTFFNLLAIVLCLFCLDDDAWMAWRRTGVHQSERPGRETPAGPPVAALEPSGEYPLAMRRPRSRGVPQRALQAFAVFTFGYTGVLAIMTVAQVMGPPPGFRVVASVVEPLRSFNAYGLFAVMTHPRLELIIEGSADGRTWQEYGFPAKPGAPGKRPVFVAPDQPRLDWQLWFAALEPPEQNAWVVSLGECLLRGTPEVLHLVAENPFATRPPRYIRVLRYEYHFTTAEERHASGNWWRRSFRDVYVEPFELK